MQNGTPLPYFLLHLFTPFELLPLLAIERDELFREVQEDCDLPVSALPMVPLSRYKFRARGQTLRQANTGGRAARQYRDGLSLLGGWVIPRGWPHAPGMLSC